VNIIIAPDSFKGNISAVQAAEAMEKGVKNASEAIKVIKIPIADGGEGTVDAFLAAKGGTKKHTRVTGPTGNIVDSFWGIMEGEPKTAVIEMAAAAGIELVPPPEQNPLYTTTYGVGELILEAIDNNCQKIILGLGGSATNDGGMGMAQALGVKFYDGEGNELEGKGRNLEKITALDISNTNPRIKETEVIAASDVQNLLLGSEGATYIYGPQKGADQHALYLLENGMHNYAQHVKNYTGIDIDNTPGAGAAGGLGAGLVAFAAAKIMSGIEVILNNTQLESFLEDASLVITGEGKTDAQTAFGKVPVGVSRIAQNKGVPVVCLSGALENGFEEIYHQGIIAAFSSIKAPMSLDDAMEKSPQMLSQASEAIARLVLAFINL